MSIYRKAADFAMKMLNLTDDAKIEKQFECFCKWKERNISEAQVRLSANESTYKYEVEKDEIKLAELEEKLHNAYFNIDISQIKTSDDRIEYNEILDKQINEAKAKLKEFKESISKKKKDYEESCESLRNQIEEFKKDIEIYKNIE